MWTCGGFSSWKNIRSLKPPKRLISGIKAPTSFTHLGQFLPYLKGHPHDMAGGARSGGSGGARMRGRDGHVTDLPLSGRIV